MNKQAEYLNSKNCEFYSMKSGLMGLKYDGIDYGRVTALRILPYQYDEEYLSIRRQSSHREKNNEIGILKSISDLPEKMREIVRYELKRIYFMPIVKKVEDVSEEYGHTMWKVETDCGQREFAVNDMGVNLLHLGNNKVVMTDLSGNRYLFEDITKMGDKTMKVVEIWL